MREIKEVAYPITEIRPRQQVYKVGDNCNSISITEKHGEMALIEYIVIEKNDGTFEEVHPRNCIVTYSITNKSV